MNGDRLPPSAVILPADSQPERRPLVLKDGYETGVYIHRPHTVNSGVCPVLFLHGIQSHPGWYYGTARALADTGFTVYQPVRRGSGENGAGRGDADSSRALLEDINTAAEFVASDSGKDRIQLLGVSWGGKLLAAYSTWGGRKRSAASLTMIAPGIAAKVSPGPIVKCGIAFSVFFNPSRMYSIPLSDPALFTDNPRMQEYIAADRYSLRKATARFLFISRSLDRRILKSPAGSIDLPVTLVLSLRDRIIDNEACEREVRRLAGDDIHVETLAGAHTLEFEEDPAPFYRAVVDGVLRG